MGLLPPPCPVLDTATCAVCHTPLPPHGRCEGACRERACHERARRQAEERLARATALRDRSAAALGVAEPAAYRVKVVPSVDAPATPLPKRRRGACCGAGGEHAYLTAERMRRYLAAHPTLTAADALEAYAGRVPAVTTRRSCVYHGTAGCALPREMRADVCNRHYCESLWRFRADLADGEAPRAFFAAVDGEGAPRRGAFVDVREVRVARRAGAGRAP